MLFFLGLLIGMLMTYILFMFATLYRSEILNIVDDVEETWGESGGFVDGIEPNVKTRRELEDMLREK